MPFQFPLYLVKKGENRRDSFGRKWGEDVEYGGFALLRTQNVYTPERLDWSIAKVKRMQRIQVGLLLEELFPPSFTVTKTENPGEFKVEWRLTVPDIKVKEVL